MCELVAKVLNMFKREFYATPPPAKKKKKKKKKNREPVASVLRDCHTTVGSTFMQVSRFCRREIWANLQRVTFATLVRMS